MHHPFRATILAVIAAACPLPALAQTPTAESSRWPVVEFAAEVQQSVINDMGRAQAYVELSDANASELAQRVNQKTAEVLAIARRFNTVRTHTGGIQTYPVYGKSGARIENWRMRSDIHLESQDIPALSDLIGRLQNIAAIGQLSLSPSPDTRRRAIDSATVAAIKAFLARAELVAQTLGKDWRIRTLNLGASADQIPVMRAGMAKSLMAETAPAPIEAGESQVQVMASGSIELLDGAK